jgi:hypothetical protein
MNDDAKNDDRKGDVDREATPSISRRDFEVVIRRAVDLAAAEPDGADESISEEEVIRIATEIGLPVRHVRRALYELPALEDNEPDSRWFPEPLLVSTRVVPGRADSLLRQIEDYLSTREYLQVVRHRAGRSFLMPADDAISNLARGLTRPSRRYHMARARRVVVSVRPLDDSSAHVQFAMDMSDQRRSAIRTGWTLGTIGGLVVGGIAAAVVTAAGWPGPVQAAGSIIAFASGFAATAAATLTASRAALKRKLSAARFELEGLLDRAEYGERLEPPAAPWRRRLQQRLFGHG